MKRIINNSKFLVLFLFPTVLSCTKEIALDESQFNPELVVNSILTPDSIFSVYVHQTSSLNQNVWRAIEDARVEIWPFSEEEPVKLTYTQGGKYIAENQFPVPGEVYTLKVYTNEFGLAHSIDTIPLRPFVNKAKKVLGETFDQYGDPHLDISFEFENDTSKSLFWELIHVLDQRLNSDNTYFLGILRLIEIPDPLILEEGYMDFDPKTFVFSNKLISSEKYFMKNKLHFGSVGWSTKSPVIPLNYPQDFAIIFRKISYSYYEYQKSWIRHRYNQPTSDRLDDILRLLFSTDPTPIYSNIEGAHGIFASYTSTVTPI